MQITGNIYSWGKNQHGQLGDDTRYSTLTGLYPDDFEDGSIASFWTSQDLGGGGTISESASAGYLTITAGAGLLSGTTFTPTWLYQIINESDFEVVAKMYFADTINANYENAGIVIAQNTDNGGRQIRLAVLYNSSESPAKQINCAHLVDGTANNNYVGLATSPIWFKVTREDETIECFYSTDGLNYTNVTPTTGLLVSTSDSLYIGLYAAQQTSGNPFNVSFSDFDVIPLSGAGAVEAVGDLNFIDVAGGRNHSIGINQDGKIWAWGDNQYGQLGDSSLTSKSSPVAVYGNHLFAEIAPASDHNLALKEDGDLYSWGRGTYGQLGTGTAPITASSPVSVLGDHRFITATTGLDHSLGIDTSGVVWAWGRNQSGQLGTGDTTNSSTPISVSGLPAEKFIKVAAGAEHSCAQTEDGDIWCWGDNTYTQSAPASATNPSLTPTLVASGGYIDIDAGGYHNIVLDNNYRAWTWGRNDFGQLGINSLDQKSSPTSVYGDHRFIDISAGELHSYALKADGTICTWGAGDYGKLLFPSTQSARSIPYCGSLPGVACVNQLPNTGNYEHSTLLRCGSTWQAWTWGCNDDGKLGDGTITNRSFPVSVLGNKKWIDMSGGGNFTIAIDEEGHIWAWGDDSLGQLGDG